MSSIARLFAVGGFTGMGAYATVCYLEGQQKANQRFQEVRETVGNYGDKVYSKIQTYQSNMSGKTDIDGDGTRQ